MRSVIGIIAKTPVAGQVKTRLCPPLTPDEAAALATGLLLDTVDNARRTGHAVCCVHAGEAGPLRALLPDVPLLLQRGVDLGSRLAAAQAELHEQGYDRVLLLGADCPTVDPDLLDAALTALDDADLVLGPASDGGYTLIGSTAPQPAAFAGIVMSTARVLEDTLAAARTARLTVALVAERHDLDTVEDLHAALRSGQLHAAPRTLQAATAL